MDEPDETLTGRTSAIRDAGTRGDVRELARQVEALVRASERQTGASRVWRALGGIAAGVALSIAGWALTLAQTAAVDHERVDALAAVDARHDERIDAVASEVAEVRREVVSTSATLVEVRAALVDVRDELRALRRETAERSRQ